MTGDWTDPRVDGCVDGAGAGPGFDGDECMVVSVAYPLPGESWFALLSARAGRQPWIDFWFEGAEPSGGIFMAPILRPTATAAAAAAGEVELGMSLANALPGGVYADADCTTGLIEGFEVVSQAVPAGSPPPVDRSPSAWTSASSIAPLGSSTPVTLACGSGDDVYLATRLRWGSGFGSSLVSTPGARIDTSTDTDLDGTADACDTCAGRRDPRSVVDVDLGLSAPLLIDGFEVAPDGRTLVLVAMLESGDFELFSQAIDFSGIEPTRLNGPLVADGRIVDFAVSPDSTRVVYRAEQDVAGLVDLYTVPTRGGAATRLSPPTGSDVLSFAIAPDSSRVVFVSGLAVWSAPLDGSQPATRLSPPGDGAEAGFLISSDAAHVVYRANTSTPGAEELFSVPIAGGSPTRLGSDNGLTVRDGFVVSPDGVRVVYDTGKELFSVPLLGGASTPLNPPAAFAVEDYAVSPDSNRVVLRARQDFKTLRELYSVPLDGGTLTKLNGNVPLNFGVWSFAITADSQTVVYRANETRWYDADLFSVPITGPPAVRLNPFLVDDREVTGFTLSGNGRWVVYRADRFGDDRFDLFSVRAIGGTPEMLTPAAGDGDAEPVDGSAGERGVRFSDDDTIVLYRFRPADDQPVELRVAPVGRGPGSAISDDTLSPGDVVDFSFVAATGEVVYEGPPGLVRSAVLTGADNDSDGIPNVCDARTDRDGDGVGDPGLPGGTCGSDNCPGVLNPNQ
jgi:hypothetical protein